MDEFLLMCQCGSCACCCGLSIVEDGILSQFDKVGTMVIIIFSMIRICKVHISMMVVMNDDDNKDLWST
jgi:hypothetical protein